MRPRDVGRLALVVLTLSACTTMPTPAPTVIDLDARPAHAYIQDVKARIQSGLRYPCVKNTRGDCEPREARVVIEFGILRDGALRYVDVVAPSGQAIYDTESADAIRRAAPFPPVPADLMARVPPASTGIPIRANFNFAVDPAR